MPRQLDCISISQPLIGTTPDRAEIAFNQWGNVGGTSALSIGNTTTPTVSRSHATVMLWRNKCPLLISYAPQILYFRAYLSPLSTPPLLVAFFQNLPFSGHRSRRSSLRASWIITEIIRVKTERTNPHRGNSLNASQIPTRTLPSV